MRDELLDRKRMSGSAHCRIALPTILALYAVTAAAADDLSEMASKLWFAADAQRIEFVQWVNNEQPCRGLSKAQIYALLGGPTSAFEQWGIELKRSIEVLAVGEAPDGSGRSPDQTTWVYQTLRIGSQESRDLGGEGSGYLLDLEIHFGSDGLAFGCGTTQYVTGGDYFEMLEEYQATER
jgi:hypothetical protein